MKIKNLFRSRIIHQRRVRTIPLLVLFGSLLIASLPAQAPPSEPAAPPPEIAAQQLSPEELKTLLAPIALYPDALVALILPASTVPSDLVLAARYVTSNGDPAQVANQPWDDSVKSLVRYPDVLNWMDQNLDWTAALGEAFLNQPADVMNAIQALRTEAIAAGNLTDSPQQQVVQEESIVRIVPAEPDIIYVPQYDPEVVYVQPYSQNFGPLLTFGAGFAVGSWLNYDCDWRRRSIYVGQWRPGWNRDWDRGNHNRKWDRGDRDRDWDRGDRDRDWDRGERDRDGNRRDRGQNDNLVDVVTINSDTARQWQPSPNSQRRQARQQRNSNRANARLSNTSVQDAGQQPGGLPTLNSARSADLRETRVPKPSRPDFTSRRNERTRRGDGSTSEGSPPAPNSAADATPGAPGENQKVSAPTAVPRVSGEQDAPGQGAGQRGGPRNLSKRAPESEQNLIPDASEASDARSKNEKKPAPTAAPDVPGEQGAAGRRSGKGGTPRNLNKQDGPQDTAPNASGGTSAMPGAAGENQKVPAPTAAPKISGEQDAPGQSGGQRGGPRNLSKRPQESQQNLTPDASGASGARSKNESTPAVAPSVPGEQGAPAQRTSKGESPRNLNKQDSPQARAPNASDAIPAARSKNEKKSAPTAAPSVPGEQGAPGPSGGQRGSPRNLDKQSQSKDGVDSQPSDAPKPKKIDQPPRSISAPNPSNGQKPVHQPAPPQPKQNKPPQQASAAERQDKPSQRSAPAVDQNTAPRPSNPSQGKGSGKGGGEKKNDEKKKKGDN